MENKNLSTNENEELPKATANKYKEIVSTLPTVEWLNGGKLCLYQGMLHYPPYMENIIKIQENFKAQPNDIVLCSFPKSGTGWLKALAFAIVTRSKYADSESPLLTKISHAIVPFIENDLADGSDNRDPDLPLVATHITYSALPSSIISSGCKIVYICRDVRDVIVSFYYFTKKIASASNAKFDMDIKQIYDTYCDGVTFYGPYWDHVLGYWKASLECPDKVLFLKFEDIKEDPIPIVKKMAEFMGYPLSQEEENMGVAKKLVDLCSIENVSKVDQDGVHKEDGENKMPNAAFFRKGDAGDWKNHISVEMAARLDEIVKEKFSPVGLSMGA